MGPKQKVGQSLLDREDEEATRTNAPGVVALLHGRLRLLELPLQLGLGQRRRALFVFGCIHLFVRGVGWMVEVEVEGGLGGQKDKEATYI